MQDIDKLTGHAGRVAALTLAPVLAGSSAFSDDWAGTYAGFSLGTYTAEAIETERNVPAGIVTALYGYTGDGISGGVFMGHNWQSDNRVYGVELGLQSGEIVNLSFGPADTFEYRQRVMIDLEARYGFLFRPDTQVFAAAGFSVGNYEYDWVSGGSPDNGTVWSTGYTVGLGVERLWGNNGILRVGLDYHSRDTSNFVTPILPGQRYQAEQNSVTVKVGYSVFLDR